MNRHEAKMIAEAYNDITQEAKDELLTSEELREKLKLSKSWIQKHGQDLPRLKVGRTFRYPYAKVINFLKN